MQFDHLKRREFITLLGGAVAAWPLAARAQQAAKRPLIVCLIGGSKAGTERFFGEFSRGMRELGYVEGRDYGFEVRYAEGDITRIPQQAEELVGLKPDVIVSGTMAGLMATKKLTDTIPIVSLTLIDPVGFGVAASHSRPGGNVTGVLLTVEDMPSKQLALAVEMVPSANKVGVLINVNNPNNPPQLRNMETAAAALRVGLVPLTIAVPDDLNAAFQHLAREGVKIVLALGDTMFLNERKRIALFAMAARLPTMFGFRENVEDGGLMSYGIDVRDSWRRTAAFVDKILKGAKPGDLPIEFPTKLRLLINLTAAKALGLEVPPTLLARADEVIE
ncbi:MAG TPA: ABC transporter substrate-binding protein [Xanthobacteraceae bacterium]|nr:ABC transporter substrate-binding protein [Xanthobacteraceae bacterium]